ncbi:sensor histidine kinase [Cytophagaceae bacterium DM2B3-1]|uniref:histidine kinase n=1 Tax=Xanthocytophaga flava TaxID=3048013 RepID=A0ABT7CHU1_9BACT|nr:sensor histidine kinase [Xanthocytophaga flavus]MDJ1493301.1 sensor histidine kinase [Xanthocytophaga flavus]
MKYTAILFLITCGTWLFSFPVRSEVISPSVGVGRADSLYALTESSEIFVDATASLSFAQVQKTPFRSISPEILRKARWNDIIWLKVTVTNTEEVTSQWLLHTGKASFIDIYIQQPDGKLQHKKSGYYRKNAERDEIRGKENSANIQLRPGKTTLYIRYQNELKIGVAPRLLLQPVTSWNEFIIERNLYEGIAQGVLLVLFLYNFLLYFILKRTTYLYYSLYILSLSIFYINVYNLGKEILLGEFPRIFDYNWATLQIVVIFLLLFICNFLETKKKFPRKHRNMQWLITANLIWGISGAIYLFSSKDLGTIFLIHRYFNLIQFANIVVLLVLFWTSKIRLARLLVLGTLPVFLGGVWDVLFRNASDVTTVHINYFQVGAIIQLILFSLSIGFKMKEEERKRRRAQEKLIGQLQENQKLKDKIAVALERRVKERTQELLVANNDLSTLNREKARLISIIAHDLNSPLNALKGLLQIFENDLVSEEDLKQLIPEVSKDVNYIANLFNNLLAWARSQMEGTILQPKEIELQSIVNETIELLSSQAKKKQLQLKSLLTEPLTAYADEEMIKLVVRNLISNAIKFTPEGGTVTIDALCKGPFVEISVQDTGKGISEENQQKLFNNELFTLRGTHNEKGSGLGLILCKDFVERNGGEIWVESKVSQGSVFRFTVASSLSQQANQESPIELS